MSVEQDVGEHARAYLEAYRRRSLASLAPGHVLVDEPGVTGVVPDGQEAPWGRLFVTDDRALDWLAARGPLLRVRPVTVLDAAPACQALLDASGGYEVEVGTAMVRRHLDVPAPALPAGLDLRPVRRTEADDDGVPLEDAAAACLEADQASVLPELGEFLAFLRSIPAARLLAAVDEAGQVRATAGAVTFEGDALVIFVSTDRAWRGQGVGTAMTAAALGAARDAGAERACLDASPAGRGIYLRLGFAEAGGIRRFIATGE